MKNIKDRREHYRAARSSADIERLLKINLQTPTRPLIF